MSRADGVAPAGSRASAADPPARWRSCPALIDAHDAIDGAVIGVGQGIELEVHRVAGMDVTGIGAGDVDLGLERCVARDQGDELFTRLHHRTGRNLRDGQDGAVLIGAEFDELAAQFGLLQVLLRVAQLAALFG